MRGRGLSRFGGELVQMWNLDEGYRGLEGEMSTIHDFNAREWDIMGTQHNQLDGKRRITMHCPGREQARASMYHVLYLWLLSKGK
jgi:hypothetical protein